MDFFRSTPSSCRALVVAASVLFLLLAGVDLLLLAGVFFFFHQESFLIMGSLLSLVLLPPAAALTLLTGALIQSIRKHRRKPAYFFLGVAILGLMVSFFISFLTPAGLAGVVLSLLLLIFSLRCAKRKKRKA